MYFKLGDTKTLSKFFVYYRFSSSPFHCSQPRPVGHVHQPGVNDVKLFFTVSDAAAIIQGPRQVFLVGLIFASRVKNLLLT